MRIELTLVYYRLPGGTGECSLVRRNRHTRTGNSSFHFIIAQLVEATNPRPPRHRICTNDCPKVFPSLTKQTVLQHDCHATHTGWKTEPK